MQELSQMKSLLLRLPLSLREKAEEIARQQGVSLNFLITSALTEWIARAEQKDAARHAKALGDADPAEKTTPPDLSSEGQDP